MEKTTCCCCGEKTKQFKYLRNEVYCSECHYDNTLECEGCDNVFIREDLWHYEPTDQYFCEKCLTQSEKEAQTNEKQNSETCS